MNVRTHLKIACAAAVLLIVSVTILRGTVASAGQPSSFDHLARLVSARVAASDGRVLFLGITVWGGCVTDLDRYLSSKFAAALTATGRVTLTDETARQAALAEIRRNVADLIDPQTAQSAGRLAGAAWVLRGTAYVFDGRPAELLLQIIRTETADSWQVEGQVPLDQLPRELRRQADPRGEAASPIAEIVFGVTQKAEK